MHRYGSGTVQSPLQFVVPAIYGGGTIRLLPRNNGIHGVDSGNQWGNNEGWCGLGTESSTDMQWDAVAVGRNVPKKHRWAEEGPSLSRARQNRRNCAYGLWQWELVGGGLEAHAVQAPQDGAGEGNDRDSGRDVGHCRIAQGCKDDAAEQAAQRAGQPNHQVVEALGPSAFRRSELIGQEGGSANVTEVPTEPE